MSNTEPNDVSVSPSDPWQQQERAYARIASEVFAANKTALFDALAAAGITTVIVNFDGCGDSGQIETIEPRAAGRRRRDRGGELGKRRNPSPDQTRQGGDRDARLRRPQ
jgi:hypothetical protein